MPKSAWEFDEVLFFHGVERYDPIEHHPPPPGYPVFMAAGKLVRLIVPTDFRALRLLSLIASAIAFVLFALAFGRIAGNETAGIAGAFLFYFSPTLLVHSTTPMSDAGALALLAAALYCMRSPALFAAFCALSIGWRIQFMIFVLPLFFAALLFLPGWRPRVRALMVFTLVCLLWFVPLMASVGGFEELIRFETKQAGYLTQHDADVSRSGWTLPQLALRFVAHPWGTKLASFPLLVVAGIGAGVLVRRRRAEALPLAIAGATYLGVALAVMDPADGVRYAIPSVLVVGAAAGVGAVWVAQRMRVPIAALLALFGCGSLVYVSSILAQRRSTDSPPVQAANFARGHYAPNAVALYELPLWPHATYFLRDFEPHRLDDGLARFYERSDVPLFLYADGASREAGATTFRWQPSDAYSKLTRNHYRVVSIVPIPPEERFRTIRGIYGPEREPEGLAWRWLAPVAELQLPKGPAREVVLRVGLPATSPIERNVLHVAVDGNDAGVFRVERRAGETNVRFDVPEGSPHITIRAERSFTPAGVAGSLNRDPRTLAVKSFGLSARPKGGT